MEREPTFIGELERSIVAGIARHVGRTRHRRRLTAGVAAVALIGIAIAGFVVAAAMATRSSSPPHPPRRSRRRRRLRAA